MSKRVAIICEGKTEQVFVKKVLAKYLPQALEIRAIEIGDCQGLPCTGGSVTFDRFKRDIAASLPDYDCTTTLFDFYGLDHGWPEPKVGNGRSKEEVVEAMELQVLDSLQVEIPEVNNGNVIPFFALHEFEALLFSDTQKLHEILGESKEQFDAILQECGAPEDINSHPRTAPSKRLEAIHKGYKFKKAWKGPKIAKAVTIDKMRQECPHFNSWLLKLEALAE